MKPTMRYPAAKLASVCAPLVPSLACASGDVQVGASFDPLERFPAEATWRWDEPRNVGPKDERLAELGVEPMVREIVTAELAAHGDSQARSSVPGYPLSYEINVTSRIRPEGDSFSIGSLSLLLADPDARRRVWVGFARAQVDVDRSAGERRAGLEAAIRRMLEGFPPR